VSLHFRTMATALYTPCLPLSIPSERPTNACRLADESGAQNRGRIPHDLRAESTTDYQRLGRR
jgi:hypothetical protein